MRECGTCNFCCKILKVEELNKPADQWCEHCYKGVGCKTYDERPESCRKFECSWKLMAEIPERFQPRKVGCMLAETNNKDLLIFVDPVNPVAFKIGKFGDYVAKLSQRFFADGKRTFLVIGNKRKELRWQEPGRQLAPQQQQQGMPPAGRPRRIMPNRLAQSINVALHQPVTRNKT